MCSGAGTKMVDNADLKYGVAPRNAMASRNSMTSRCSTRPRSHSSMSYHFVPFSWEPRNAERGGGMWIPPTPSPFGESIFELNEQQLVAGNKSRGHSPAYTRSLMLNSRDKESLLEEIIRLKQNLNYNDYYMKRNKVHAALVETENKKLVHDIRDLEMLNFPLVKSPKSTLVRGKLQDMKTHYEHLRNSCDLQHDEISELRRDVRVTFTREVEVERDVILDEIVKLQKEVRRLKQLHGQVSCENKELGKIRDRAAKLEAYNYNLENIMDIVNRALEKANRDCLLARQKATEWALRAKRNKRRQEDLDDQIRLLKDFIKQEQLEKTSLDMQMQVLDKELEQKLTTNTSSATPVPTSNAARSTSSSRELKTA